MERREKVIAELDKQADDLQEVRALPTVRSLHTTRRYDAVRTRLTLSG